MQKGPAQDNQIKTESTPWVVWALTFILIYYVFILVSQQSAVLIPYTQFKSEIASGNITKIWIKGHHAWGLFEHPPNNTDTADGNTEKIPFESYLPVYDDPDFVQLIKDKNVQMMVEPEEQSSWLESLLGISPWFLLILFLIYTSRMLRKKMRNRDNFFGLMPSSPPLYEKSIENLYFNDGVYPESTKQDLQEIIDCLKVPSKFSKLGATSPRGVLLIGLPGTGKTFLARATAGEAKVPFFSIRGSEVTTMFASIGASQIRDMFREARKSAPALIFIDDIDSVCFARGTEQILNQILIEMDSFTPDEAIIVLAATHRPDILDPALFTSERFSKKIILELPLCYAREQILSIHTKAVPLEKVDLKKIAKDTVGLSGASLKNLVNEAALRAVRLNKEKVDVSDFEYAMNEAHDSILTDEEKSRIAYHEAGHAIIAFIKNKDEPLQKISILARGCALRMTEQTLIEHKHYYAENDLTDRLCIFLGGRCSEKLIFGNLSNAADDLEQATILARRMIAQWGMSQKLGAISYPLDAKDTINLRLSETTASLIDNEVSTLIANCEKVTLAILEQNKSKLEKLAQALIEKESLNDVQIKEILKNG